MSDFFDLCARRQATRGFADKPLEHDKIVKCIEAARLCPSGCNAQPWKFIVVESPEKVAQVAEAPQQLGMNAYAATAKAFVIILEEHAKLMPQIRPILDSQVFARSDIGGAMVTICYAAEEQGVGSLVFGIYDRPQLCEILGLPEETRIAALIGLGYPAKDEVRTKTRKPMEETVVYV